jgi:cation diffusion facilitator family transporter
LVDTSSPPQAPRSGQERAEGAVRTGVLANAVLAAVKLVAGLVGGSYALVADAVESTADVLGSLVVLGGLRVAARSADDVFPFGYGKAEPLSAAVVGLMLLGAAVAIAVQATIEMMTPHSPPEPWTLGVLVGVVVVKEGLSRWIARIGREVGSVAVRADAQHQRGDALTSAAAAVGILATVVGGPAWAVADEWAAIVASFIICWSGIGILRPAVADLMDRSPSPDLAARIEACALAVPGVCGLETVRLRRSGLGVFVDLHVEADGQMPLVDAHALGGKVRATLRREVPEVLDVLVHMEPAAPETPGGQDRP